MVAIPESSETKPLSAHDLEELAKLVNTVALSENSLTLYAIAPESSPDHPVTEAFAAQLRELEEPLQFRTFFYSDNSLFNFLATLNHQAPPAEGRRIIFAFGLEQLPRPRLKQELEQLNRAREKIFEQNLVLVFWLNRDRFLNEFRDRAPDFWDWRGKVVLFEQRHPLLYPYLEWLIAEHSYLRMSGVMQVNRQVDIFLDQIYVSLQAERQQQITTSKHQQVSIGKVISPRSMGRGDGGKLELDFGPEPMLEERSVLELDASSTKTVVEPVDLADVVRGTQACSVILGAPGAGKTTLLKYLALHFAKALREKQDDVQGGTEQESLGQPRWPIYLKIADYAERLESHPELSLLDYLERYYRSWEDYFEDSDASALVNLLLERMQRGNCLILLDGLDEVFDQDSRRQIVESINQFADQFGHNKLIVTSRIAGYQEVKLSSRFTEFTITDMTDEQVSEFLHRWCRAVERAQKPEATAEQQERAGNQQVEQLLSDIERNEGVKRLTANPLLLTILALIHRNGEKLPARRVRLYELAVQTLTADWQLSKKLPNAQKVLLPEGEVVELLAPLAYWMHEEKPSGRVTHAEVIEQLAPRLAELRGEAPDSPEVLAAVEEFLRRVRETTGLFVERAPDVYGFMHLTFEEYFAARFIADHDPYTVLKIIRSKIADPRWKEPILLTLGFLNDHFPKRSRVLVEKLFGDLIQLGRNVSAKQKRYPLETIKLRLYRRESKLLKQKSKRLSNKFSLALCQLSLFLACLPSNLLTGFWITKYFILVCFKSDYAKKTDLAFQTSYDIELNRGQQSHLLQGLIASTLITEIVIPNLPEKSSWLRKYSGDFFSRLEDLKDFSSKFAEEVGRVSKYSGSLEGFTLESLKKLSNSLSIPKYLTNGAQKLFFQTFIACGDSKDAVQALDLRLPAKHQASACKFAGDAYQEEKKYKEAILYYEQSQEIFQQLGQDHAVANRWYQIGYCYKELGEYERAVEYQRKVIKLRKSLKDKRRLAFAYFQLGQIYRSWDKYEEAIECFEKSCSFYRTLCFRIGEAHQYFWIAFSYQKLERYEQAVEFAQRDLVIRKKLGDRAEIASTMSYLGWIYESWNKYGEAIRCHERSRNLYERLKKESDVAKQWYWIADCYREWGKYEEALVSVQHDIAISQELDDQPNIADAYYQLGRIYQAWGKYDEAISYHEQSRDLYQQMEKESNVANRWYWIAACYYEWGKYEQTLAAAQHNLAIRQKLNDQSNTANAYFLIGCIYQAWGKYDEAIDYHQQSLDLYQQLKKESNVASQWYLIALCYQDLNDYSTAIESLQKSLEQHQALGEFESTARRLRQLTYTQVLQAKSSPAEAIDLLQQADRNLQQAIQLNTTGDYRENLAYDYIVQALLIAAQLQQLPPNDNSIPDRITQFEQAATEGFDRLAELGQAVSRAEEAIDIARAYLEVEPLKNLDIAEDLARQSLATFQEFNRRKLQASAYKLLGEIYLDRRQQSAEANTTATEFLTASLSLYQELDITQKVIEVEQLLTNE